MILKKKIDDTTAVLSIEEIDQLSEQMSLMKTGRLQKGENRNANIVRNQLNNFLRACWEELPGAKRYDMYSQYRCKNSSYESVVMRVADVVHKFLFFGKDSITISDGSPISLFTRDGLSFVYQIIHF